MPWWAWLLDAAGAVFLLIALYGAALVVRRRWISRGAGTFELSHRVRRHSDGRGWMLGMGRYTEDSLEWFRVFSLSPRPRACWRRGDLDLDSRRPASGAEAHALYPDHVVICCRSPRGEFELAMSVGSLTGFQSWLEARQPGTDWTQ